MILRENKKISNYRKAIYCFLTIIATLLIIMLMKIDSKSKEYNPIIYNEVYEEYHNLLDKMSEGNMISDAEIQEYMDERIKSAEKETRY